jgi:hypothetical protein
VTPYGTVEKILRPRDELRSKIGAIEPHHSEPILPLDKIPADQGEVASAN